MNDGTLKRTIVPNLKDGPEPGASYFATVGGRGGGAADVAGDALPTSKPRSLPVRR
jgi:hypothetical protein